MSQRNTNSSKNSSTLGYAVTAGLGVLLGYMAHKFLSSEDENRSRTEVAHQHEMKPPMEQLPCEHLFHQNCILTWLDTQGTCPICRLSLNRKQLDAYRGRAVH